MGSVSKSNDDRCIFNSGALLIGFSNLVLGNETKSISDIQSIFENYRNNFKNYEKNPKELSYKYFPISFYTFHRFDLCTISVVDEFQFASRTFRPYNLDASTDASNNSFFGSPFYRQVHQGPLPQLSPTSLKSEPENIYNKLKYNPEKPLFGLIQIKLSDIQLIRSGTKLIRHTLRFLLDNKEMKPDVDWIISENNSWYEINLICLAASYKSILEISHFIRCIRICDLEGEEFEDNKGSLVSDTDTRLGFRAQLFDKGLKDWRNVLSSSSETINARINFRKKIDVPALLMNRVEELKFDHLKWAIGLGNGDYDLIQNDGSLETLVFIDKILDLRQHKAISELFESFHSIISTELNFKEAEYGNHKKKLEIDQFDLVRKHFLIEHELIAEFNSNLIHLGVPKILKESLVNIISIYNNAIKSGRYFSQFIEFRSFLLNIIEQTGFLSSQDKKSIDDLAQVHKSLDLALHAFNYASHNRQEASFYFNNLHDNNVFYDGGIHLLISSFDGLTKIVSDFLGSPGTILYIEAATHFSITLHSLRANYFHIFHPEKMVSILFAEIANLLPGRFPELKDSVFQFHNYYHRNINEKIDNLFQTMFFENPTGLKEYRAYLDYVNDTFFEHFFADLINYRYLYKGNFEHYSFWFWGYFYMTSSSYEKKNGRLEISVHALRKHLLRYFLICEILEKEPSIKCIDDSLTDKFKAERKLASGFVHSIYDSPLIKNWVNEIHSFIDSYIGAAENNASAQFNTDTQSPSVLIKMKKDLKEGKVLESDFEKREDLFFHTSILLQAYLENVYELKSEQSVSSARNYLVLPRKAKSPDRDAILERDEVWYFDPMGGIFAPPGEKRDLLFKMRNVFHYSLFAISLNYKRLELKKFEII